MPTKFYKYSLILSSFLDEDHPSEIKLAVSDNLKKISEKGEKILLAIAEAHGLHEWVDDAIYAIDPKTDSAVFAMSIVEYASGKNIDPEL